jgi:hypothetical protein
MLCRISVAADALAVLPMTAATSVGERAPRACGRSRWRVLVAGAESRR